MKRILLIIITLHLSVFDVMAASNLYTGEADVAGQSESERQQVLPDALIQVLKKLSGLREIPISPALDAALGNAENLLLSFGYENIERTAPDGSLTAGQHLVAEFMPTEVDKVVQDAGLPRWQHERPAVELWIVVDDGITRKIKPLELEYAWESVENIAEMRGLPISWPEFDEEELQLIDMRLLWGGFTDYLVERGAPADGVAIMAARREGSIWTLRWNVSSETQNWSWRSSDQELMFALAEGMHRMTDQIAATNSISAAQQGLATIDISIGGLTGSTAYINCLAYLQNVSLITEVEVMGAAPGQVDFRLQLNASPEFLAEAFRKGSALLPARAGSDYDYVFIR